MIEGAKRIVPSPAPAFRPNWAFPDFRSPGGIWTKYQPIYFDDFMSSEEMRRESWRRKFATDETMVKAEPNAGHRALAKLVEQGRMTRDHHPEHRRPAPALGRSRPSKIIELHGNTTYATCLDCGQRYELAPIRKAFESERHAADLREVRRHREDGDDLVRPGDARDPDGARPGRDPELRPVHRPRQLAGGLSGGRLPAHCQAAWCETGDPEPRPDRPGRRADLRRCMARSDRP